MDANLLVQLADAGFPVKVDPLDGSKKQEPTVSEFYSQTGKLFTTWTKDGWVSRNVDGSFISKPQPTWQEACSRVFLDQKAAGVKPGADVAAEDAKAEAQR